MKVDISLSNGDCIEIHGIVGENKLEIEFSNGKEIRFKCCLRHEIGWDVCVWNMRACAIQSGTLFTSLEYCPGNQFILCLQIQSDYIVTVLNEIELNNKEPLMCINEITSMTISGDSLIRQISFSDQSKKSNRFLLPVIDKLFESSAHEETQPVTLRESRQRYVFKAPGANMDNISSLEYDSDSESEIFETSDVHSNFDYLKKIVLQNYTTENDDLFAHYYINDIPSNRYIISYFDPEKVDYKNSGSNTVSDYQVNEIINEESSDISSRLNRLRTATERIEQTIANTGLEIEKQKCASAAISDECVANDINRQLSDSTGKFVRTSRIPTLTPRNNDRDRLPSSSNNKFMYTKVEKIPVMTSLYRKRISLPQARKGSDFEN